MGSLKTPAQQLERNFKRPQGVISVEKLRDEYLEFINQAFQSTLFGSQSRHIVARRYSHPCLIIPLGTNEQWFCLHEYISSSPFFASLLMAHIASQDLQGLMVILYYRPLLQNT
jgi:hypothetical protein